MADGLESKVSCNMGAASGELKLVAAAGVGGIKTALVRFSSL